MIGVTGTDGKSTTTYLIDQILSRLDQESGFISTALIKRDIKVERIRSVSPPRKLRNSTDFCGK